LDEKELMDDVKEYRRPMKTKPLSFLRIHHAPFGKGSALVIVLCLVVLLTVVVLAVLSRSIFNGLLSNASANVSKADIYGHGAINQIIGDLRQEVVAGSSTVAPSGTQVNSTDPINGYIYLPKTITANVPAYAGPSSYTTAIWTGTLTNLLKQSSHGVPFYPNTYDANASSRAIAVSTDAASLDSAAKVASGSADGLSRNGRYISMARWNKALLLPKNASTYTLSSGIPTVTEGTPTTDVTPVGSFVAPDWILTAADGSNPTSWPGSPATTIANPKSTSYVVGRYAYTIYNEGGLLDANVAGSMSAKTAATPLASAGNLQRTLLAQKGSSAFADLTQLPGIAALTVSNTNRPQQAVDSIILWRNAAETATASGATYPTYTFAVADVTNYFNYLGGIPNNFMSTGNTTYASKRPAVSSEILTDRMFTSRQELISYLENTVGKTTAEQAYLQDALSQLGTFSRTLNQPSYWPDSTRPKVLAAASTGAGTYGNSAFGLDDTLNPSFRKIRVGTAFTRNDGSTAVVGEPLVKKRFALSRLMWLTYEGPSALVPSPTTDSLFKQYVNLYTGSLTNTPPAWLTQLWNEGTAANIKAYFGLTWRAGPGTNGAGGYWDYDHGFTPGIGTLSNVAGANREPDFFELLQAGVNVGGIAKLAGAIGSTSFGDIEDTTVFANIMQLGANIIDQANPTQYPTHLVYPYASGGVLHSAYGVMDLPYLDSVTNVRYIVQPPNPASPATTAPAASATPIVSSYTASTGLYSAPEGTGVFMQVPSIWNPYDVNGPQAPSTLSPGTLRICVSSALTALNQDLDTTAWPGPSTTEWNSGTGLGSYPLKLVVSDYYGSTNPSPNAPGALSTGTTTDGNGTVTVTTSYAESQTVLYTNNWTSENSTALLFANSPSLYREPTVLMRTGIPATSNLIMDAANPINAITSWSTAKGVPEMLSGGTSQSGANLMGFFGSTFPLRWSMPSLLTSPPPAQAYYIYTANNLPGNNNPQTPALYATMPASGVTVRLTYQPPGTTTWIPYMEYFTNFQYTHDFMPVTEAGTAAAPYELSPNNGSNIFGNSGSIWNNNRAGSPGGGLPGRMICWDGRTQTWGFPVDVGPNPLFLDGYSSSTTGLPVTDTTETSQPGATSYMGSHSAGTSMVAWGTYEPSGGPYFGLKQQNLFSSGTTTPSTDYYADADGTVRRAIGAYIGPLSGTTGNINGTVTWTWTANTPMGLPLASTATYKAGPAAGGTTYTPVTNQSQSRPIILHRPYRSVAELGNVFSNIPFKNIDFATPESAYSALLDVFCINEDYRPDAVAAGRVDLNTRQAPVIQALIAGACRDENVVNSNIASQGPNNVTQAEAAAIAQDLVKRTTVGNTNPNFTSGNVTNANLTGAQPLSNIGDLVGRWITGTTVGTTTTPINGVASYDGLSADLSNLYATPTSTPVPPVVPIASSASPTGTAGTAPYYPGQTNPAFSSGSYNIIKRFRESTMRALSDAGQAGTWNLLIDVVAQSGRYPTNASGAGDFIVEGEHRYWVHVAIDRTTGQIIDENIEPVNE
jgi:hypothetical protein